MSATQRPDLVEVSGTPPENLLTWAWPVSPVIFKIYDKYADVEVSLMTGASTWTFFVQGHSVSFDFLPGERGALQQKLIMLTQRDHAPSSIYKFTRSLLAHWGLYIKILEGGPSELEDLWEGHVKTIDTAKAGKALLKLAVLSSLGPWRNEHEDLVGSLDTRANPSLAAQQSRLRRREQLLSLEVQSQLVKVLDNGAERTHLSERQAEGLAALALIFQHGMRPVQLLSLRLENIWTFTDAADDTICVVSFHTAKQRTGKTVDGEMARQIKQEWSHPVIRLREFAQSSGRDRLFGDSSAPKLWTKVKRVCAEVGVKVNFTAKQLRHTSAQALADAGHSRRSLKWFLGHSNENAATTYIRASRQQVALINLALGTSPLYNSILSLASGKFVSIEELSRMPEEQQIGGVVGARLIAGIGQCSSGQSSCGYDPVSSCYSCPKYIPALNPAAHMEAIAGMREQILTFLGNGRSEQSPAYLQMTKALAGAQKALEESKRILGSHDG
ncbi:site-specific integrase [Castellaniella sp. MT123]|uniref:site-specific integrase n=1 Tax=Castellaniella sp. MT123 TaxID=3140381 RepID=UPI0031F45D0B